MFKNFLFARVILVVILLFIASQAIVLMRGKPRQFTEREMKAVEMLCSKASDQLRLKLGGPRLIGVAHFLNDGNDAVTDSMRESISQCPEWKLIDEGSVVQKFLGDIAESMKKATTLDEILHAGHRVEMNVVIVGRVNDVKETETGSARAEALVLGYNLDAGETILNETFVAVYQPNLVDKLRASPFLNHTLTRLTAWLLFVALLPLLTSFATVRALEKKSNLASFILISVYTCLDILVGVALRGSTSALVIVGGFLACGIYNYLACEKIAADVK